MRSLGLSAVQSLYGTASLVSVVDTEPFTGDADNAAITAAANTVTV